MYDVKMYVYVFFFTKLIIAMRLSMYVQRMYVMFTHLSTQILQREMYVCMQVCMRYCIFMILPNQTLQRVIMFFAKWHGYDAFLVSAKSPLRLK